MTGDYNLIGAAYKSTLQKLVNRVLITDKNNNVIKTVEDAASIQRYGLVQRMLKQNDGEDATVQARKMLVAVESSATVTGVPNDFRAMAGYSMSSRRRTPGCLQRRKSLPGSSNGRKKKQSFPEEGRSGMPPGVRIRESRFRAGQPAEAGSGGAGVCLGQGTVRHGKRNPVRET